MDQDVFSGLQYAFIYLFGGFIAWVSAFFVAGTFFVSVSYLWLDMLARLFYIDE